jgi:hypothetical protein
MLSAMQYPHWLMGAGAVLVVFGFVGIAFRQKPDHKPTETETNEKGVNDEDQAPTRVKHRQGD